ncbi:hypothetical protein [Streptomyces sp. NPDC086519]|uniref:hypothetical protein n=1 Tax=Streptomyces sp. NPDC086519 TaxID=3154863 RepID=UPI00343540D5
MSAPGEQEDNDVDITFDFTEHPDEPFELLSTAGPQHPPTILLRSEPLMPMRFGRIPD